MVVDGETMVRGAFQSVVQKGGASPRPKSAPPRKILNRHLPVRPAIKVGGDAPSRYFFHLNCLVNDPPCHHVVHHVGKAFLGSHLGCDPRCRYVPSCLPVIYSLWASDPFALRLKAVNDSMQSKSFAAGGGEEEDGGVPGLIT